jgi:hypothetical protein
MSLLNALLLSQLDMPISSFTLPSFSFPMSMPMKFKLPKFLVPDFITQKILAHTTLAMGFGLLLGAGSFLTGYLLISYYFPLHQVKPEVKAKEPDAKAKEPEAWCAIGAVIKFWRKDSPNVKHGFWGPIYKANAVAINTPKGVFQLSKEKDTQRVHFNTLSDWEKSLPSDGYFTLSPDHNTQYSYGALKAWSPNEILRVLKGERQLTRHEIYSRIGSSTLKMHNLTNSLSQFQRKGIVVARREGNFMRYSMA